MYPRPPHPCEVKDEDFVVRRLLTPGPAIVWLRLGNTRRAVPLARIDAELPAIVALLSAETPSSKLSEPVPSSTDVPRAVQGDALPVGRPLATRYPSAVDR